MATEATDRRRRARDPQATREAILEAACTRLAQDGPEGLSLSEVAQLAGVNRGTAYQHFETRENLIRATTGWVSEKLYHAVFGDHARPAGGGEDVDVPTLTDRMAGFAMANPELCRIWLLTVLASPDPGQDLFWREYVERITRFAGTDHAQPAIDPEVLTVLMMAGTFLWPVFAQARTGDTGGRAGMARRFSSEVLRLSMFGSLRTALHPEIAARLEAEGRSGVVPAA